MIMNDVRYHSADDMMGVGEFENTMEPVAVVIRPDGSADAYGYVAVIDQRSESSLTAGSRAARCGQTERTTEMDRKEWTIGERDEGQWWIFTEEAEGTREMQGPYPSFELAEGDARANSISAWQMPGSGDVLLCDPCYEELTGDLSQCQDVCSLSLDHTGECHSRPRTGQAACDRCGQTGRLTRVDVVLACS